MNLSDISIDLKRRKPGGCFSTAAYFQTASPENKRHIFMIFVLHNFGSPKTER